MLPPGYSGTVPDGYFLLKPATNRNFLFLRGSIKDGLEPAVKNITSGLKVYPLRNATNPAPTEFVNVSGKAFNTVFPSDFAYFENLNKVVQEEPIDCISPEVRGAIASIGIVKGKPFAPDARMRKLLMEAATLGNATARVITYHPRIEGVSIYPDDPKSICLRLSPIKILVSNLTALWVWTLARCNISNAGGVTPAISGYKSRRRFRLRTGGS